MVQGLERREGAQDQNPQKAMQADSVPLSTVMYPRHASMEGVGKTWEALGEVAGALQKPLENLITKYKDQSIIDGELMFAQGKAEEEVAATGNSFAMQGFQTMQAKSDSNTWYNTKLAAIDDEDKMMDPTEYRRKLSADVQPLLESVNAADPSVKHFVVQNSVEHMSDLVRQQVKSNAKWKQDQTVLASTNLVGSQASLMRPEDADGTQKMVAVKDAFTVATHGLPQELSAQVIGNSLVQAAQRGDTDTFNAYLSLRGEQPAQSNLTNAIMMVESGGRRFDKDGGLLRSKSADGTLGNAYGEFQILLSTAEMPGLGVKPAKDNSPEELSRTAKDYIRGLEEHYDGNPLLTAMAYNAGPGAIDEYLAKGDPRKNSAITWRCSWMGSLIQPGLTRSKHRSTLIK